MKPKRHFLSLATLLLMSTLAICQGIDPLTGGIEGTRGPILSLEWIDSTSVNAPARQTTQPLLDFKDSEIKFALDTLMNTLRDRSHEGWVLAAYPDPKTRRPLIGAGFSLDVERVDHPQRDPLNSHLFLEPSSADLWQAAGLRPKRLQQILERYQVRMREVAGRRIRRRVRARALAPEVTDEEATRLLRISAIQAIYNARAYCRRFDRLSGPQQMALSQLVFQMGVNLEEFVQFLATLNSDFADSNLSQIDVPAESASRWNQQHWQTVQQTLMDSQWARLYSDRAASVIAMFDPTYPEDPYLAQQRIQATLRPTAILRRGHRSAASTASLRAAAYTRKSTRSVRNKSAAKTRHGRNRKA